MNSFLDSFSTELKEKVQCYALDNILHPSFMDKIKVIKMDVEGFEYNVLLGMNNLLDFYQGPIILEVTYYLENYLLENYNPDRIYDFLLEKGFQPKFGKRYANQYNDFFIKSQ